MSNEEYTTFGDSRIHYRIYRDGRLWSSWSKRFLADNINSRGYVTNRLFSTTVKRHKLVAKHYLVNPRPDIFNQLDHIDRDKTNNHADNLRWVNVRLNQLNTRSRTCARSQILIHCHLQAVFFDEF